jgi:hypothetical protein
MMVGDPFIKHMTHPDATAGYLLDAVLIIGVLVTGIYGGRTGRMLDHKGVSG